MKTIPLIAALMLTAACAFTVEIGPPRSAKALDELRNETAVAVQQLDANIRQLQALEAQRQKEQHDAEATE